MKKIKLTLGCTAIDPVPFCGPDVTEIVALLQQGDDQAFAEALAVAREAGVIVVTRKDRDNPLYFEKGSRRPVGGIELNTRLRKI